VNETNSFYHVLIFDKHIKGFRGFQVMCNSSGVMANKR